MNTSYKSYLSLTIWVVALVSMSSIIGLLTKTDINTWYTVLNRSPLTPPNSVFPIAWTLLYIMIAACGWIIWQSASVPQLRLIKSLYAIQLVLNWIWTPIFFSLHLTGLALVDLIALDVTVAVIIYLAYTKIKSVSLLMTPYLLWILFATYLNYYVWQYN